MPSVIDIAQLFEKTFGIKPYLVPGVSTKQENGSGYTIPQSTIQSNFTDSGSILRMALKGVSVLLPIEIDPGEGEEKFLLPYCVISVSGSKTIIETALAERAGTVKEQFNIEDYVFRVKGFIIGDDRKFPEKQIEAFKNLYEKKKSVKVDNALTNIFLKRDGVDPSELYRVVIAPFDFDEVQGGREHIRPFTMTLKSDTVFTLELDN